MQKELPSPASHVGAERRQWIRHACDLMASYRQLGGEMAPAVPWRGAVVEIGVGGFRLLTSRPIQPGVFLSVELQSKPPELAFRSMVQVMRSNKTNDGWEIACVFVSSLSESKLRQLLLFPPLVMADSAGGAGPVGTGARAVESRSSYK